MSPSPSARRALAIGPMVLLLSTAGSWAQVAAPSALYVATPEAVAACEFAARQALAAQAPSTAEVTFTAPAVQQSLSSDSQLVLRGAARWRGAGVTRKLTYSCNVGPRSAKVAGVVLRDVATDLAAAAPGRAPAEPDLTHLSPAACESSAAEALKKQWPRVSQISFDRETRRFAQSSATQAELHGHGRALPAPGSPSTHFGFDCAIDPRDGRVLATRLSS